MTRAARRPTEVKVYRVGGSVRDELMGRPVVDRDWVVIGATPEILTASGYKPVGRDFPVFLHRDTGEEYALARTERKHGRGYRGFEFFASPDVTLAEDLARRDLTINAMARDEHGTLIDPFGGEADLRAGVLRHVSPAFVEDPLRVLRVARFAARFGFKVAPETSRLMRKLVASGELADLSPERVWQELSRGLMEPHPAHLLGVLHKCGALSELLQEVDALYGTTTRGRRKPAPPARSLIVALQHAAKREFALPVRYAVLTGRLGKPSVRSTRGSPGRDGARRDVAIAERIAERLKVPVECRDAARLAARWGRVVSRAQSLPAAAVLDLFGAADALRRPVRLEALLETCESEAMSTATAPGEFAPAPYLRAALEVVKGVDAGAVARDVAGKSPVARRSRRSGATARGDAVARAIRARRLSALRVWMRTRSDPTRDRR
jgi:tRNA nucleotidyltransferase (CCA-adding enzyme)